LDTRLRESCFAVAVRGAPPSFLATRGPALLGVAFAELRKFAGSSVSAHPARLRSSRSLAIAGRAMYRHRRSSGLR
jgi:hypothetical protein